MLSRSDLDYTNIISTKTLDLNTKIINGVEYPPRTPPSIENKYAAFDLEALKYSGKMVYWGRKNYWDNQPVMDPNAGNPYPTLSTIGLSRVITEIIRKIDGDSEITNQFLSYWIWDKASPDDVFTSLLAPESGNK